MISKQLLHRLVALFLTALVLILGLVGCQSRISSAQTQLPTVAPSAVVPASPTPASPTPTATSSPTASPTIFKSPTPGPSPTPSNTPTATATPTETPIPSATPTTLPQIAPSLAITGAVGVADSVPTPATAIPTPVPTFAVPLDVTNVLLLGSDTSLADGGGRTDTMIIVSISHGRGTASIMSLPRDLYVYIPGKRMDRLNTAVVNGVGMLKQTILYNFGVPIHYYARIDFEGFRDIVDAIGGVDIVVSCALNDWRLKSPELDINDEDNWEKFLLEPGAYHMDGDLALWYARSRLSTNDFERGRRQQQLLRAILNQGVDLGLLPQVPTLWNTFQNRVETDMDIGRVLQLAALAPAIRQNGVQHLYLAGKTTSWSVPDANANVQLPVWQGPNMMEETFRRLFHPPSLSRTTRPPLFVEVVNASDNPDLALLAADNLAWYGFVPVIADPQPNADARTHIAYYQPNFKEAYEWLISWILGKRVADIEFAADESFPYDYRVTLGNDYDPCRPQLFAPQAFINP